MERRAPLRPARIATIYPAPLKEQVAELLDIKFVALIMLSVLAGLWIVNNQPPLWVIALIVISAALLSIPLLAISRREMQSKPV